MLFYILQHKESLGCSNDAIFVVQMQKSTMAAFIHCLLISGPEARVQPTAVTGKAEQ